MKIKFLGVGGAFAPITKGNSNMLLTENNKNFLVDCGTTAQYIIRDEWKMSHSDIDTVWVSHLHADHIGGLEWMALMSYFVPKKDSDGLTIKPKMFAMREIMQELWESSLKGGLETIEGKLMNLTDYFTCCPIMPNNSFEWEKYIFYPVQTIHIMSGYIFRHSYGLMITNPYTKKKTFITTDTQFAPYQLHTFYQQADIIFHDCETTPFKSHVHAHYQDLVTLPEEIKKKMWLYHYAAKIDTVEKDGFLGFVDKNQEFEI